MAISLFSLIQHIACVSTSLNYAKLHSESKYLGNIPFIKLNILLVLATFSDVVYELVIGSPILPSPFVSKSLLSLYI